MRLVNDDKVSHDELAFLMIDVADEDGHLVLGGPHHLEPAVTGPAKIAGLGVPILLQKDRYNPTAPATFRGRALVVLRATAKGAVNVRVRSAGLLSASISHWFP